MRINYVEDVRAEFRRLKASGRSRAGTLEIQNAQFRVDSPTIFGSRNEEYIAAELEWYESQSLFVKDLFDIYGKEVKIWKDVADELGMINSNYGWCIYSEENGSQYDKVHSQLWNNPESRQAIMIYTNPDMHTLSVENGRKDFMCTTHVQYFINNDYLHASVYMRSNDAIFGFINDFAWQRHVLIQLAADLSHVWDAVKPGFITWNAGSLHVYERHWDLIK